MNEFSGLKIIKVDNKYKDKYVKFEFIIQDVSAAMLELGLTDKYILYIGYTHGKEEERKDIINDILAKFKDDDKYVIITSGFISQYEYSPEEYQLPCDKGDKKIIPVDEVLERESKLFESLGFIDINHYVLYEYSVAFIYNDKFGYGEKINNHFKELQEKR